MLVLQAGVSRAMFPLITDTVRVNPDSLAVCSRFGVVQCVHSTCPGYVLTAGGRYVLFGVLSQQRCIKRGLVIQGAGWCLRSVLGQAACQVLYRVALLLIACADLPEFFGSMSAFFSKPCPAVVWWWYCMRIV
jgi:hypothetical protein